MRTEAELDYLEEMIPEFAESATKKAHLDALSRGKASLKLERVNWSLSHRMAVKH